MSEVSPRSGLEYSRQLQEKFELYLLALIFTLLGLAVQTAKFDGSSVANILELLGWISLIISGLAGLSRFEWLPVAHKDWAHLEDLKISNRRLLDDAEIGVTTIPVTDQDEPVDIHAVIQSQKASISQREARLAKIEKWGNIKYSIHKWLFVCGLIFLAFARGYAPLASTVHSYGNSTEKIIASNKIQYCPAPLNTH